MSIITAIRTRSRKNHLPRPNEFVSSGVYVKSAPVWAEVAEKAGKIKTNEGETAYEAGDYLVYNNEDGTDAYAMSPERFKSMYGPADIEEKQSK